MSNSLQNPRENQLGFGVTEDQLRAAISYSGYPLQTRVAEILRPNFGVQQEWGFRDDESGTQRSIDLRAGKSYWDHPEDQRIRPRLHLLIECKQSELPYIFFDDDDPPLISDFPRFCGLPHDTVVIQTDDDMSTWSLGFKEVLGLLDDPFITTPMQASMVSKGVRKGKKIELSGTDSYNNLILPLTKAREYFAAIHTPSNPRAYYDLSMLIAVAVLDAPMISTSLGKSGNDLRYVPWVRVNRDEILSVSDGVNSSVTRSLDIVHVGFLGEYVKKHLLPFAERFAVVAKKHREELASGKAFAKGMGADSWNDIEHRLTTVGSVDSVKRVGRIGKAIALLPRNFRSGS